MDSPTAVEYCLKSLLENVKYRNNKEYYVLPLKELINKIHECIKITKEYKYKCGKCLKKAGGKHKEQLFAHINECMDVDYEIGTKYAWKIKIKPAPEKVKK